MIHAIFGYLLLTGCFNLPKSRPGAGGSWWEHEGETPAGLC